VLWTAPYAGTFRFQTHESFFSTVLYLLSEDCEAEMACDEDGSESETHTGSGGRVWVTSAVTLTMEEGQTVVVVVEADLAGASGSYEIDVVDGDGDGDGFDEGEDCDDTDPSTYPGAPEACDGKDNDCDELVDEGLALYTYFTDSDGDGYGVGGGYTTCAYDSEAASVGSDCNDMRADVHPGMSGWFTDPYMVTEWVPGPDAGWSEVPSWDYNCDGAETKFWDSDGPGVLDPAEVDSCFGFYGWDAYGVDYSSLSDFEVELWVWAIPDCGESELYWRTCENDGFMDHHSVIYDTDQMCH